MLQLEIRHYETIVAIVELGTMTEAARRLCATQSALSHRLAEAERRLGVRLFERGPQRRLRPTMAGVAVHQSASRALAELERTEAALLVHDHRVTATVRIGVGSYDSFHWYPALYASGRDAHPDIEIQLVSVDDNPATAVADGTADVVIAAGDPEGAIDSQPVLDDELVCFVAPGHHLAGRAHVSAEDLADETYLTYNPAPTPGFEYNRFLRPAERSPRIVSVIPQTSAIVEMVAAGAGVSILSRWALTPAIEGGRIVPIRCGPDGLPLPWRTVLRAGEPPGSPARRIADLIADQLSGTPGR